MLQWLMSKTKLLGISIYMTAGIQANKKTDKQSIFDIMAEDIDSLIPAFVIFD